MCPVALGTSSPLAGIDMGTSAGCRESEYREMDTIPLAWTTRVLAYLTYLTYIGAHQL